MLHVEADPIEMRFRWHGFVKAINFARPSECSPPRLFDFEISLVGQSYRKVVSQCCKSEADGERELLADVWPFAAFFAS